MSRILSRTTFQNASQDNISLDHPELPAFYLPPKLPIFVQNVIMQQVNKGWSL